MTCSLTSEIPSLINVLKSEGLTRSNFLVWTGLRQSVPSKLCVNIPNFKVILDLEVLNVMTLIVFLQNKNWKSQVNGFS